LSLLLYGFTRTQIAKGWESLLWKIDQSLGKGKKR
jgi:hypothetical protein